MRQVISLALLLALTRVYPARAQQGPTSAAVNSKKKTVATSESAVLKRLNELTQAVESQQQQIRQLQDEAKGRESQVQQLQQQLAQTQASLTQAQAKADTVAAQTAEQGQTVTALKSDVTDLKTTATNSALTLQETQKHLGESPAAIHYKGITITPGGFLAAETVWRSRALGADVNTPLNGLNLPGSGQNNVSEFFASGRQSRVTMLAEGKLSEAKLTGYYEADFLSAGVTSNNNQSNSYTMRQRQIWGQAAYHNWTVTGGQMWSLVTETKKGVDNRTEVLPMTIDAQYHVGFSWARQFGFRVAKNFSNRLWLAGAIENPQTTFTAHNNASNFAFGGPGNGGGLYNSGANYSFNATPDIILKAAFEPGFGHYEIFGIYSRFRDRVYPCVEPAVGSTMCSGLSTAAFAYNSFKNGGGIGANARVTIAKKIDFGLHALMGNGVGRYGTSSLPDATVNPDGTLGLLRSYQGLATLEFHWPRFDVYFNGGEEYIARRYQTDPVSLKSVGYGSPELLTTGCYAEVAPGAGSGFAFGGLSNCTVDTRYVVEGSMGFWYRLYNGPKGRLQFGPQYSYLSRNMWTGTFAVGPPATFSAPHGIDNMVFTSFRYYLP